MTELITRYENGLGHGWYVGSHVGIVLASGEPEVWPGMFEAHCRQRGLTPADLWFRSDDERREFLHDVHASGRGSGEAAGTTGRTTAPRSTGSRG